MQNLKLRTCQVIVTLIAFLFLSSASSLQAEDTSGITSFSMNGDKLIIVDANNKKILLYELKEKGLFLKEVRSFEDALSVQSFSHKSGLSVITEREQFKKLKTKTAK